MHEYSFAQNILEVALKSAEKNNAEKIKKIKIEIGEFTFLNPEQLKFVLETISKDTIAENSKIEIEIKKGKIKCHSCGYIGNVKPEVEIHNPYIVGVGIFSCPKCKNNNTEIIEGRECNIKSIEIEK
ncbi:MAG: hydrogenase maturation nickel metallochaperone HypA [Candidatus Hydrothermarchaeota archaeon]|nr:MAG: hydrogenase maturation nickel metallochaperone HypA [Candidatus Hydrothermarchaeota archaeon]